MLGKKNQTSLSLNKSLNKTDIKCHDDVINETFCQICSLNDNDNLPELNCNICLLFFHVKCSGIQLNSSQIYSASMMFVCPQCYNKMPKYPTSSSPPTEARLSQITNQLSEALAKFDSSLAKMKVQYEHQLNGLRNELNDKIGIIADELKELKSQSIKISEEKILETVKPIITKCTEEKESEILQLNQHVENLDRLSRLKFVIIRGIPVWKNENLREMIEQGLCPAIDFKYRNFDIINLWRQRTSLQSKRESKAPPIIVVEFISKEVRDVFLKCYYSTTNLSLDKVGFEIGTSRIYVNEYLTKKSKVLLDLCTQLKKDDIISQAFSRNGMIFVREMKSSTAIQISAIGQVADLKLKGKMHKKSVSNQQNILQASPEERRLHLHVFR